MEDSSWQAYPPNAHGKSTTEGEVIAEAGKRRAGFPCLHACHLIIEVMADRKVRPPFAHHQLGLRTRKRQFYGFSAFYSY